MVDGRSEFRKPRTERSPNAEILLGLSDQIPKKVVFLTDGPTRSVKLGKQTITLKRTTPKNMATAGKTKRPHHSSPAPSWPATGG